MKPRNEQAHEDRHRRHAGFFNAGHKRKPTPADRDLLEEFGWGIEEWTEYFEEHTDADETTTDRPATEPASPDGEAKR